LQSQKSWFHFRVLTEDLTGLTESSQVQTWILDSGRAWDPSQDARLVKPLCPAGDSQTASSVGFTVVCEASGAWSESFPLGFPQFLNHPFIKRVASHDLRQLQSA